MLDTKIYSRNYSFHWYKIEITTSIVLQYDRYRVKLGSEPA